MAQVMGDWIDEGICKQLDTADAVRIFYPASQGARDDIETSKRICEQCSVQRECLEWALLRETDGTWGGLTEWERRKARKASGIEIKKITKHNTTKEAALRCTDGKENKPCTSCQTFLKSTYGKMYERDCRGCGMHFKTNRPAQFFHNPACSRKFSRAKRLEKQSA